MSDSTILVFSIVFVIIFLGALVAYCAVSLMEPYHKHKGEYCGA